MTDDELLTKMVEEDLGRYNDNNWAPKSLTIPGERWRHYELGPVVGFVIYAYEYEGKTRFATAEIHEDDGNWFVPGFATWMSAVWLDDVSETLSRMVKWKNEHLRIGWNDNNEFEATVVKPIEEEEGLI